MDIRAGQSPSAQNQVEPVEHGYQGLVVIIPSRNRSDLARRAIGSCLDSTPDDLVQVMVSDNSTEESEIASLSAFCRELNDPRVHYVRPPEPLNMANHWEWAFQQALDRYDASHFTLLADRRIYFRGAISELCGITKSNPDKVIASLWDTVLDHIQPVRAFSKTSSGRLIPLQTDDLLQDNARATWAIEQVPTPFISIIPRRLFGAVRERFGDYCLSLAPDYCFGYRVLDLEESILLYDKSMSIMLGANRSSGYSLSRGVETKDKADFIASNGGSAFRYSMTPCPEIISGYNGVFHEYNFVQSQTHSGRFPKLDLPAYLQFIESEIDRFVESPDLKSKYREMLAAHLPEAHGSSPDLVQSQPVGEPQGSRSLARWTRKIRDLEPNKSLWRLVPERLIAALYWKTRETSSRLIRKLSQNKPSASLHWKLYKYSGVPLPTWLNDIGFASTDQAIEYLHGKNGRPHQIQ